MLKPTAPGLPELQHGPIAQVGQRGVDRWAEETYRIVNLDEHYRPWPKQEQFHRSKARKRLMGGAAGPGKTLTAVMDHTIACNDFEDPVEAKQVHTLLLRRTFPNLQTSVIRTFQEKVPRELYKRYNESKHVVTWHNGATTHFGAMQYEKDVWNYQGSQWMKAHYDELTEFLYSQWSTLAPWVRCPVNQHCTQDGSTNPIGPGALFVMQLWGADGKGKRPCHGMDENQRRLYNPDEYEFIPATYLDNPIYANNPAFLAALEQMPAALRDALKYGLWTTALGTYYDIWDPAVHVMAEAQLDRPRFWPLWLGIDWGFEHNAAIYWFTTDPKGNVYIYREYVVNHLGPKQLAESIVERTLGLDGKPEIPAEIHLSFEVFAKRTDADPIANQMAEVFKKAGWPWPAEATRDKMGREQLMYQMLKDQKLFVLDCCPRLIETVPIAPRDKDKIEQIADFPDNDPLDAAGYGLYGRIKRVHIPLAHRVAAQMEAKDKLLADAGLAPLTLTDRYRELVSVTRKERKNTIVKVPNRWRPRH